MNHVYVLILSNITLLSITEISLDNVISYSNYLRSGTRSFEEKNEVKFKQDNKYQLKQCGTPENTPYILARRHGTPEKSMFFRSNKPVRLKKEDSQYGICLSFCSLA